MALAADASALTEIEGAILSKIAHRGNATAFRVRRAFELSPSIEWSGSAGAIYPAIRRLRDRDLLAGEETGDRRATVHLSLTSAGEAAMILWACDAECAASVGIDPFRLRVGIWSQLGTEQRDQAMQAAGDAIRRNIAYLKTYLPTLDVVEAARVQISLEIQRLRLRYHKMRDGMNE